MAYAMRSILAADLARALSSLLSVTLKLAIYTYSPLRCLDGTLIQSSERRMVDRLIDCAHCLAMEPPDSPTYEDFTEAKGWL